LAHDEGYTWLADDEVEVLSAYDEDVWSKNEKGDFWSGDEEGNLLLAHGEGYVWLEDDEADV